MNTLSRAHAAVCLALVALFCFPMAAAEELAQSNSSGSTAYAIHNKGNTSQRALGQVFWVPTGYSQQVITKISVWASATAGSSGNVCVEFEQSGSVQRTSCRAANSLPGAPNWVDFPISPYYLSGGSYYAYYVYYDSTTCTTCVKAYYSTSNVYRSSDSTATMLFKQGFNAYYSPNEDAIFRMYWDHTPLATSKTPRNVAFLSDGVRLDFVGGNDQGSGLPSASQPTQYNYMYQQWGLTTGYGSTSSAQRCDQGYECWTTVWGLLQHTVYHSRSCGYNYVGTQCGSNVAYTTPNWSPGTASTPTGPTYTRPGVQEWFYTSASDAGDSLYYELDVNNDGTADASYGTYSSGSSGGVPYTFSSAGSYSVRARARDTSGCTSVSGSVCLGTQWGGWSGYTTVVVDGTAPSAPNIQSSTHASGTTWYNNNDP